MRSFFRRPSWAVRGDEDLASNFYRRAKQTYPEIVAASIEARARSTVSPDTSSVDHGKATKRRRLSNESCVNNDLSADSSDTRHNTAHDNLHSEELSYPKLNHDHDQDAQTQPSAENKSTPEAPNNANAFSGASAGVVANRENTQCNEPTRHESNEPANLESDEPTESNDPNDLENKRPIGLEKNELTVHESHKIVEHGRPKSPESPSEVNGGVSGADFDDGNTQIQPYVSEHHTSRPPETVQEDLVVQILITSEIEHTRPLIVRRKMSQSLRDVRLAWCKRQNLPAEMQSSVILTWKGRKLFDVTTCRSLGINTKHRELDDSDDDGPRVHMEAVMEDAFVPNIRRDFPDASNETESRREEAEFDEQEESIRIVLKCPGKDEFKVKGRPKTPISRLTAAFRDKYRISADRQVYLSFDGDRLDPNTSLEDHDIADLDLVDVQIK